jgi:5-methylcytosine-specific restriction endonuclease McrA
LEKCQKEIKKCILVCKNCHREVHGGLHSKYIVKKQILFDKPSLEYKVCRGCNLNLSMNNYYNGWDKCLLCKKNMAAKRADIIKRQCLNYKGSNCCIHCGYDKYIGAIDFHHVNSTTKEFRMSKLGSKDFGEEHKMELDKCIALCAICHKKEHHRLSTMKKIIKIIGNRKIIN